MPPKSAIFESHPTGISGVFLCGPGPNQARFETLRMEVAKVWVGFPRSRATEVPEKLQSGQIFLDHFLGQVRRVLDHEQQQQRGFFFLFQGTG